MITETQGTDQPTTWEGFPPDALENIMVGSCPITFVRGAVVNGIYDPEAILSLVWDTGDLSVKTSYFAPSAYPARMEKDEIITIAESME